MNQRPTFTLAEAANLVGVSRSSVRRRLDQGAFSNAYKTPRGIWKIPLPDLLEAGLNPVSGAFVGVSQTLSGDISQGQSDIGHDISQREQHELKNRVIELETALSIERAHRTAAEQVGDIQRQRAETAESALRILESVIPRSAIEQSTTRKRTQDMPGGNEDTNLAAAEEPTTKKSFWKRWTIG